MLRYYAGIGSRKTPERILKVMEAIAKKLEARQYRLRSGGADGADAAFERGSDQLSQIFLPWGKFNGNPSGLFPPSKQAYDMAQRFEPNWLSMRDSVKALKARNAHQVLGMRLDNPSTFVVCWTPDGAETAQERSTVTGGTGLAIAMADEFKIPVFNLKRECAVERLINFVNELEKSDELC